MNKKKLAVFVSGRGSNFISLHKNVTAGTISLVVSDNPKAGALDYAAENHIDSFVISVKDKDYVQHLLSILQQYDIDYILLAGYLKKIPDEIVEKYRWRILNIHPALLPKFGGKGMYGINVHRAVLQAGESESGVTIHFIDEDYDKGLIIAQEKVPVLDNDTPEILAKRVLEVEHTLYPKIVQKLCEGKIKVEDNKIIIKE